MKSKHLCLAALLLPTMLQAVYLDPTTNLQWLELTETTNQSAADVLSGSFVTSQGYRYATSSEVETLFTNIGLTLNSNPSDAPASVIAADNLFSLLGITGTGSSPPVSNAINYSYGFHSPFEETGQQRIKWAQWRTQSATASLPEMGLTTVDAGNTLRTVNLGAEYGHFLVKSVPDTGSTALLLGAGLLGLAAIRRRMGRS